MLKINPSLPLHISFAALIPVRCQADVDLLQNYFKKYGAPSNYHVMTSRLSQSAWWTEDDLVAIRIEHSAGASLREASLGWCNMNWYLQTPPYDKAKILELWDLFPEYYHEDCLPPDEVNAECLAEIL